MMCANCTSNSKMSVTSHRRCDEPANGTPTTVAAMGAIPLNTRATRRSGASCSRRWCSPYCILIIETPVGFIEKQPAHNNEFVGMFELNPTRMCRCKPYITTHRKETIIFNNMAGWPLCTWDVSRRMCSASSPCQPLWKNGTRQRSDVACWTKDALSAGFKTSGRGTRLGTCERAPGPILRLYIFSYINK